MSFARCTEPPRRQLPKRGDRGRRRTTAIALALTSLITTHAAAQDDTPSAGTDSLHRSAARIETRAQRYALDEIFGDEFLAEDVHRLRRRAEQVQPAERFDFLADWVLPGDRHPGIRLSGEFTQNDPPPASVTGETDEEARSPGGELISPVFDLLDAAAATGRLAELQQTVAAIPDPQSEYQRRAKAALRLLIALELGDRRTAAQAAQTLHKLVLKSTPESVADMWPETLAVDRGLRRFGATPEVGDLLVAVYMHRTKKGTPRHISYWHSHIAALMHRYQHLTAGESPASLDAPAGLADWLTASRGRAEPRAAGAPPAVWHRTSNNEIHHLSGIDQDYLFYRIPLTGNFEIEGDIGADATTQFYAAGRYFGPRPNGGVLESGTFRSGSPFGKIDPPLSGFDSWVHFRVTFQDRIRSVYFNGRLAHTERLTAEHDPWIAVRSWSTYAAKLRDVRITGNPNIPEVLDVAAAKNLAGWNSYSGESVGFDGAIWRRVDVPEGTPEIRGRRLGEFDGTLFESLLYYHRPLTDGDAIEYDFFYDPGKAAVHPAFDRFAFLLDPHGVQVHWITDGQFDPRHVDPGNVFDEPRNRRGPEAVPLNSGWNHVRLALAGNTAALELNGRLIYEREMEGAEPHRFGLFRYAERSEARVRNMRLQGNWPRTLPSASEQELAEHAVAALDADLPRLTAVFEHDFVANGLPTEYFIIEIPDRRGLIAPTPDGLQAVRPGFGPWSTIATKLRFSATGDFDVEAVFDAFSAKSDKQASIGLMTRIDDKDQHRCRLVRMLNLQQRQQVNAALSLRHPSGRFTFDAQRSFCEADAGRLRIARRGDTVYYLFAENDSPVFRLLRTQTVSDRPLVQDQLALLADCNGTGETSVIWKKITLRAEHLTYLPLNISSGPMTLYTMNVDGTGLRRISEPVLGYAHLGSPEWSADGSRIALDMARGGTDTSHIIVMNADGTDVKDVGPGCMPSFSPDGKRIVCSVLTKGIVVMDADGSNREIVDRGGWGVQWSPDGKYFAYGNARKGNVTLMDVETKTKRKLIGGENADRYEYVFWNLGWSHNSRFIAFKGRRKDNHQHELAVVGIEPTGFFKLLQSRAGAISPDFTWSADDAQVVFSMNDPAHNGPKLYQLSLQNPDVPQLLPHQPPGHAMACAAWSPDRQKIAFCSVQVPVPVDWPPDDHTDND